MSENEEVQKLESNEIVLFGKTKQLQPYKGKRARLVLPKVVTLASGLMEVSNKAGFNLADFLSNKTTAEQWLAENKDSVFRLIVFISTYWQDRADDIERLLPFLLQVDAKELENDGDPIEVYWAMFKALKYMFVENITPEAKIAIDRIFRVNPTQSGEDQETTIQEKLD